MCVAVCVGNYGNVYADSFSRAREIGMTDDEADPVPERDIGRFIDLCFDDDSWQLVARGKRITRVYRLRSEKSNSICVGVSAVRLPENSVHSVVVYCYFAVAGGEFSFGVVADRRTSKDEFLQPVLRACEDNNSFVGDPDGVCRSMASAEVSEQSAPRIN
jgi:hypothetical protein